MNARGILILPILLAAGTVLCQVTSAPARSEQRPAAVLDGYQGGWTAPDAERSLDQQKYRDDNAVGRSQLDQYRQLRNEALVHGDGDIGATDKAVLQQVAESLNSSAPGSFEANMATYYQEFPSAAAFMHLELAAAQGADRSEVIAPQLVNAARKDQKTELNRWARAMKERGGIAPGLYRLAQDILLSVDKDGLFIAAGEMDAYPLWVEQYANAKRPDVLVMDQRLLEDQAYRARMWERANAKGPVPSNEAEFLQRLPASTARPVLLSLALGQKVAGEQRSRLYVTGLAMRLSDKPIENLPLLEANWGRMNKALDTGPLARNYLVPGAILLKHYRTKGDEKAASELEHELRGMATRTGSMRLMLETGTFTY